jgi:hypothetical protein
MERLTMAAFIYPTIVAPKGLTPEMEIEYRINKAFEVADRMIAKNENKPAEAKTPVTI